MAPNSSDDKLTDFCSLATEIVCNTIVYYNKCQLEYLYTDIYSVMYKLTELG